MISHSDLSHNELCKTIDTKDIMKLDRDCFPFYLHIFEIAPSVFKFTELLKSQDKNIMKKKKGKTAVYVKHAIAKRLEIL